MPALKHSKIEDFAFDYLSNHYAAAHHAEELLVRRNQSTKQGHRADGIFVYKADDQSFFTASFRADPSAKLSKLLLNYKKNGLGKWRYATALVSLCIAFLAGQSVGHVLLTWGMSVAAFLVVFLAHSFLEEYRLRRKIRGMVDEMRKQPADEQWLGLSISSMCFRNNIMAQYLLNLCERRGIGLLTVGKRAKLVLMQEPKTKVCRRGDFLSHYSDDNELRFALLKDAYLRAA